MISVVIVPAFHNGQSEEVRTYSLERHERLAEAMGAEDTVVEVAGPEAAADVYLVAPTPPDAFPLTTPSSRTVILGCARGSGFEAMARTGAAGAVEDMGVDYWAWGLAGGMRPTVIARSALLHDPGWVQSVVHGPDIVIATHPDDGDLPSLLRRYAHEVTRGATP